MAQNLLDRLYLAILDMKPPLVSIIVPCFNARQSLTSCLSSLFSLSYPNFEVLVVDDASTDGSPQFIQRKFGHYRNLKILVNSQNLGPSRTRNLGIHQAKGQLVAFFETDMAAHPAWITRMVNYFTQHPEVGALHGRVLDLRRQNLIQADGLKLIPHTGWVVMRHYGRVASSTPLDVSDSIIGSVGTVARRQVLLQVGGFDRSIGHKVDDLDLGWRIWLAGWPTVSLPTAITYHWGGKPKGARPISDLKAEKYFHRMTRVFIKNYEFANLIHYLPWLIFLHFLRAVRHVILGNTVPFLGFLDSLVWTIWTLPDTLSQRRFIQKNRRFTDAQLMDKIMVKGDILTIWRQHILPLHHTADTLFHHV